MRPLKLTFSSSSYWFHDFNISLCTSIIRVKKDVSLYEYNYLFCVNMETLTSDLLYLQLFEICASVAAAVEVDDAAVRISLSTTYQQFILHLTLMLSW